MYRLARPGTRRAQRIFDGSQPRLDRGELRGDRLEVEAAAPRRARTEPTGCVSIDEAHSLSPRAVFGHARSMARGRTNNLPGEFERPPPLTASSAPVAAVARCEGPTRLVPGVVVTAMGRALP